MFKIDKLAGYVLVAMGVFQAWYCNTIPLRADEAYIFLKVSGFSWAQDSDIGLYGFIIRLASYFGSEIFILRLPSVIMTSFAGAFIYRLGEVTGGRLGAWAALITFLVTPTVHLAYTSATPAALLLMLSSFGIFFFMVGLKSSKINYFILSGILAGLAALTSPYGLFLAILPLAYIIIFKKTASFRKQTAIFYIFFLMFILVGIFSGINFVATDIPYIYAENKLLLLILGLVLTPAIPVALFFAVSRRFKDDEDIRFLHLAIITGLLIGIIGAAFGGFDMVYLSALSVPAFALIGCYYTVFGYQAVVILLVFISALLSGYSKLASNLNLYLPSSIHTARSFEALIHPVQNALNDMGGALIMADKGSASILSYLIAYRPAAETALEGKSHSGVFVTDDKSFDLRRYFSAAKPIGVYKIIDDNLKSSIFYIYYVVRID